MRRSLEVLYCRTCGNAERNVRLQFGQLKSETEFRAHRIFRSQRNGLCASFSRPLKSVRHGTCKKSEFKLYENVADIFYRARLEAEPLGHHFQAATQFFVAHFNMVSNFAAFERSDRRVGYPPPSYPLPFLQLFYFAT